MKRFSLITFLCWALLAPSAFAAEGGWYVGAQGGVSFLQSSENDSSDGTFNTEFDPGYAFGGTIGFDLGEVYPTVGTGRIELEIGYRRNDVDTLEFKVNETSSQEFSGGGDVTVLSAMLNTFGELREFAPFYPYVGGGIGLAHVSLNDITVNDQPFSDDSDTVFAWQVGAGLGIRTSPYLVWDIGYRYFSADDPSFSDALGVKFDAEYDSHTVFLGARLDF